MKQSSICESVATEDWRSGGFALYVHWPFCQAKCPYCDFNSHVSRAVDDEIWADAFVAQIELWGRVSKGRTLTSIFFGGGTPSLMSPKTVEAVIAAAQRQWVFSNEIEITLEANPASSESSKFQSFSLAGVNRLSLGLQSLDDRALRSLGRLHSAEEAVKAYEVARGVFPRTSFDVIYARQHQPLADWQDELTRVIAMEPQHLSLYQLTVEEGTVFSERQKIGKLRGLPDEDLAADMYLMTQSLCESAGLRAYEVSNHAQPGAESRHNLVYWRYGDYIGIGPGAHGRVTIDGVRHATTQPKQPSLWLETARNDNPEINVTTPLSRIDEALECTMMGLRLAEGIDLGRLQRLEPSVLNARSIDEMIEEGLLWRSETRMGTTPAGRPLLNRILRRLL